MKNINFQDKKTMKKTIDCLLVVIHLIHSLSVYSYIMGSWRTIACLSKTCRSSRSSAKWLCSCRKPWFLCTIHAPIGHLSGATPRSPPEKRPRVSKRPNITHDHAHRLKRSRRDDPQADRHDQCHMRVRKRRNPLPNSYHKKHKKDDDAGAIAAIDRLREAARAQSVGSGTGSNL